MSDSDFVPRATAFDKRPGSLWLLGQIAYLAEPAISDERESFTALPFRAQTNRPWPLISEIDLVDRLSKNAKSVHSCRIAVTTLAEDASGRG
jgi:hypothetical protein